MHKILKSILCLTLAFATLFVSFSTALATSSVSVASAPMVLQSAAKNGMVRVYLSSMGSPSYISLTISGSYSLSNGTSLTNGEMVAVSFNSGSGAITLSRGGTSYNMGTRFTLRRHSTTGSNGVQIAQSRKPGNLYPGDIEFKSVALGGGGYKLYTIAHIYIEDYLYGVVPYEMGSSAPLEALKAQAVAARTYTMRMKGARSSWSYDVVDTTGDQTYNGTPTTVTKCNTAVDQTKGVLLQNGSSYTATYYSASNGGQTESIKNAWRTSGYDYLGVKDDPFDYANPASVVKQETVYQSAGSSYNNASLLSLLKTKAVSALITAGYNATTGNTSLQTIADIQPHTPKYASPSRVYTKMDFTVSVTTYNANNVFASVTTTVTCDIFNELEGMLELSIQSGQNELWSVVETGDSFKIQARRYGHGLGMSQRGAMYMGQLGFTYDEILGFYYQGSTRVGCTFTNTILSPGSSEVISTIEDPVNITDTGTTGSGVRGIVTLSNTAKLAVRSAKEVNASVLTVLPSGTPVDVLANDGTWCLITFGSITGYVQTAALSIIGTAPESDNAAVSSVDGFAVVNANGYLNLRQSGNYSASVVSTAPSGAILTVLSWNTTWAHIQYGTIVAYAAAEYLNYSAEYPAELQNIEVEDEPGNTADTLSAIVATQSGSLNLRQFPQAGSTILTTIPKQTVVSVTEQGTTWSAVSYQGYNGYVMSMFLSLGDGSDTGQPDAQAQAEISAMVWTQSGSLNLRQQAKTGSAIYTTIPRETVIAVHSKNLEWCQVTYNGITGYVMTVFLKFLEDDGGEDTGDETNDNTGDDTEPEQVTATVTTESGSLNLRADALKGSRVLARIPQNTDIPVLQKMETWTYTSYGDYYGYVMNVFLTFSGETNNASQSGDPIAATVATESGSLNLRNQPHGKVLTQIPQFAAVDVLQKGSAWCYLNYSGIFGYVMTEYLSFETGDTQQTDDTQNDDANDPIETNQPDTTGEAASATVAVESGSLNLRAAKSDTAQVLTTIPNSTVLPLLTQSGDWCKVAYGAFQGYVQTTYLYFGEAAQPSPSPNLAPTATPAPTNTTYSVAAWVNTTDGSLNLRQLASQDAAVIVQIPQYAQIEVLSDITAAWCQAKYAGDTGYVMSEFLTTAQPSATAEPTVSPTPTPTEASPALDSTLRDVTHEIIVYVRPPAGSVSLGLYDECSESSELLQNMMENNEAEVLRVGDTWCEVLYLDQLGYCLRDGLSFIDE